MTRPLRILAINQFFYPDSRGGVESVAYETLRRLAERGHSIDLVGQRTKPGTPDTEDLYGVTVHRYGGTRRRRSFGGRTRDAMMASRAVIERLLERDFDVVLPHHYFPYYSYLKVAGRKVVPEIMTFHASYWQELRLEGAERQIGKPFESLFFGTMAKRTETACLRRADRIIVLSAFSREQLLSYYPFAADKVVKIPGGVDLKRFRPADDRGAVRRELGLPEGRPVLFTARRLVPRMGLSNLLEGFAQARSSYPAWLVVAGRGRLEEELASRAKELGIADDVRFVGFVEDDDLVKYYQAADLFVLPSLAFEGFGMVTLEALACGTPALGTPIGATPEILNPLAQQLVLDGPEPPAIRRGIQVMLEWLSNGTAAESLRAQCRSYVEERYGWGPAVDALEGMIEELVDGGGRND